MLLFTLVRSDHLKHSTHTNCQQVALSCIPVPWWRRIQFIFFTTFTRMNRCTWNFDLKFLTLCFSLVGVIIWNYQLIATNSRNLHSCTHPANIQINLRHPYKVILLSQIKKSLQRFRWPRHEPAKNRDFFLGCVSLMPIMPLSWLICGSSPKW